MAEDDRFRVAAVWCRLRSRFRIVLFQPMPLTRRSEPFSHPDWLFELKWDGLRCLAYIEHGRCRLVLRNGNEFKSFLALNSALHSPRLVRRSCALQASLEQLATSEQRKAI